MHPLHREAHLNERIGWLRAAVLGANDGIISTSMRCFGAAVLLFAAGARAETIKEKVQVCAGCHGENGKPVDKTIPTIWGQQAGYLYFQLRDFKRGDRKNDIMQPIASTFERDDMLAIAEYVSQKPCARSRTAARTQGCRGEGDQCQSLGRLPGLSSRPLPGDGTVPRLAGMGLIISPRPSPISARVHAATAGVQDDVRSRGKEG